MKRICLFAGYDRDGIVDDYVIYYIKHLAEFADVFYYADCDMKAEELRKLDGIVKGAYAKRHGKYDFGSWGELMKIIGFDNKCVVLLNVHDEKKIMYKSAISTIKEDKYVRDKEE